MDTVLVNKAQPWLTMPASHRFQDIFHFPRPVSAPALPASRSTRCGHPQALSPSVKGPQLSLAPSHQPSATLSVTLWVDSRDIYHPSGRGERAGLVLLSAAGQAPASSLTAAPSQAPKQLFEQNPSFPFSVLILQEPSSLLGLQWQGRGQKILKQVLEAELYSNWPLFWWAAWTQRS